MIHSPGCFHSTPRGENSYQYTEKDTLAPDWDEHEINFVLRKVDGKHILKKSGWYQSQLHPLRVQVILSDKTTFSLHAALLTKFSKTLATRLTHFCYPNTLHIQDGVNTFDTWHVFVQWLYTVDKRPSSAPLPHSSWTIECIINTAYLASFLYAPKFDEYILRLLMRDIFYNSISKRQITELSRGCGEHTGIKHFCTAWLDWKRKGGDKRNTTTNPFFWSTEHWYHGCGRRGNWGCHHGDAGLERAWKREAKERKRGAKKGMGDVGVDVYRQMRQDRIGRREEGNLLV